MKFLRNWLTRGSRQEQIIGALCVLFSLFLLLVWIPSDIDSGLASKVRGRSKIGDALAPTMTAVLLGIAGLAVFASSASSKSEETIKPQNFLYIAAVSLLVLLSCGLMYVFGPLVVDVARVFVTDLPEYRTLRSSVPWKYLGYLVGSVVMLVGFFVITGFGSWKWRLLVALLAALALALAYDLPFDDLLLPPNGDI